MHTRESGGQGYASEINITPLVDVVLVLLIIFMMIVPVMLRGYDVDMPGETVVAANDARARQVVLAIEPSACPMVDQPPPDGLPAGCSVRIDGELVVVSELGDRVRDTFADKPRAERVIFLAADDRLSYEGVMRILDLARSDVEDLKIGLVTSGL